MQEKIVELGAADVHQKCELGHFIGNIINFNKVQNRQYSRRK